MGYTKTYTGSVYYSQSVSYPASEHGGSTSVSGSVPVSINLFVDTSPFDASVVSCNAGIAGLESSVIAMNSAQVSQIKQSADEISKHVTHGFFSMIKSEISQNMAALFSKINSSIGLITEKTQLLSEHQKTMQEDYSRVQKRYQDIFQNLDEECHRRIVELDRAAFHLSQDVQKEQISNQQGKQVASLVTGVNEDELVQLQVGIANLNNKVGNVISSLYNSVNQEKIYSSKLSGCLHEEKSDCIKSLCIPVVYAQMSDMEVENSTVTECFAKTIDGVSSSETEKVTSGVAQFFTQNNSAWEKMTEEENDELQKAFNKYAEQELLRAESEGVSNAKRIYDTIMRLRKSETLVNR